MNKLEKKLILEKPSFLPNLVRFNIKKYKFHLLILGVILVGGLLFLNIILPNLTNKQEAIKTERSLPINHSEVDIPGTIKESIPSLVKAIPSSKKPILKEPKKEEILSAAYKRLEEKIILLEGKLEALDKRLISLVDDKISDKEINPTVKISVPEEHKSENPTVSEEKWAISAVANGKALLTYPNKDPLEAVVGQITDELGEIHDIYLENGKWHVLSGVGLITENN